VGERQAEQRAGGDEAADEERVATFVVSTGLRTKVAMLTRGSRVRRWRKAKRASPLKPTSMRAAVLVVDQPPVDLAIERIVRALNAVGDRYAVLLSEQVEGDPAEIERLVAAPMRAVFSRGIESGLFRQDLSAEVLLELFGGSLVAALKLIQRGQLGLEEASAAAASVFLDGARAR
jgi:hypothetical protein